MPEGWSWTRIQNITQICLGLTHTPKYVESGIPFYSVKDISSGGLDTTNPKYISAAEFEKFPDGAKPQYGDILFGRVGTLGKPTIVNTNSPFGIFVSLGFFRKYSHEITSEFFVHWMNSSLFWDQVNMNVKGAVLTNLNTGWLSKFLIPIPPSKEQTRIVAQCEIAIRYLEEIENTGREISNLISATKSKILDLAIRGKLVPQNPNDEPASILLERIRAEKEELIKQGKIKRDKKESVIFKGDDNSYYRLTSDNKRYDVSAPFDLPDCWEWTTFPTVAHVELGKTLDKVKNTGTYYPYLRSVNVQWGYTDLSDVKEMKFEPEEIERYTIKKNDLLICEGGDVGRCCVWNKNESILYQNAIHRVRFYNSINCNFYMYFMMYLEAKGTLKGISNGVTIKHLTNTVLSNITIPLPPLVEQERIVNAVETLFAQIDKIAEQIS